MATEKDKQPQTQPNVGNASNPSPQDPTFQTTGSSLLGEGPEKYLREVSSPEDYPDAKDEDDMNDTLAKEQ